MRSAMKNLLSGLAAAIILVAMTARVHAEWPANVEAELRKLGRVVEPGCTAKLVRAFYPKNDYNTYWPANASAPTFKGQLYPGITITRDQSFGPHPKDLLDIFVADAGSGNRPVLIFVPGGGGNKIEQQVRESNAFYDNLGRWATKNGMVAAVMQRHAGPAWDDGGRDVAIAVDWLKENVAKYRGDPNRMVIWSHSAGNGPLGVYIGHPERWKNGVQVKGAIFMSGNPVPGIVPAQGGGVAPGAPGSRSGVACGLQESQAAGPSATGGAIAGPSSVLAAALAPAAAPVAGRAGQPLPVEQQAERDNLPGFKKTPVKIMLARAELDPGVSGDMLPSDKALRDALCAADGPNAKEGEDHCPMMLFLKGESHMSEVFSFDTADRIVSGPILAWIKRVK